MGCNVQQRAREFIMALRLYRRYRQECEGVHPEDARTGEVEERRRGWEKWACPTHAPGTLAKQFNRRLTPNHC